jgi:phosphoribosylamine--glycine ligase
MGDTVAGDSDLHVVVVGSGGREHALATVLGRTANVVVTPGNPGIPGSRVLEPDLLDPAGTDLVVVGPEAPLVDGLADRLRQRGVRVLGPGADGARLEGSKAWMKDLFAEAGIPTARHGSFDAVEPALAFLDTMGDLFVVKTDGLAAGKGVVVTDSRPDAEQAVRDYLSGAAFGDAGRRVVIEEGLTGPELSVFALTDGVRSVPMGSARDHKRIGDGDTGPNTGGMGAFSPVPSAGIDIVDTVMDIAIEPTVAALAARGIDYRGFLFCGLMLTPDGPRVLEYNVRFGDPEAQVVLPRITSDLVALFMSAADGKLSGEPTFDDGAAVTVVCAAPGYPVAPVTGAAITGIAEASAIDGVTVYCAGVAANGDPLGTGSGESGLITAGGRVLSVTGQGPDVPTARQRAYDGVACVAFDGMQVRSDIASSD